MSIEKPILPYIKKDTESSETAYIRELENRVKDLVEIRDTWMEKATKFQAQAIVLQDTVIEIVREVKS